MAPAPYVCWMRPISAATRSIASVVRQRAEAGRRRRVAPQCRRQPVGMRALQVALHALRAEHAAVEREVLPRLEADHLVVAHLELDAALLAAEAAVRLHQPIGLDAGRQPHARHRGQVRPEPFDDAQGIDRNLSHVGYLCLVACRHRAAFRYCCHNAPCARPNSARRHLGQTSW